MICYKDKTFCEFSNCKTWDKCDRALTKPVQAAAQKWWGKKSGAPICLFSDKPDCFVKEKKN